MNRTRRTRQTFSYDNLEPKNLLAGVTINGTAGDDVLLVEVLRRGHFANITLNGALTENVNIRDGLTIDLGEGQDTAIIDDIGFRLPYPGIEIHNTHRLEFVDGNNLWKVHDDSPSLGVSGDGTGGLHGTVNNNVFFFDAMELVGGSQVDTFNIHSFKAGIIMGGEAIDVFRFGDGEMNPIDAKVFGGDGNDYFSVHGEHITAVEGGEGFDRITFVMSDLDALLVSVDVDETPAWNIAGATVDLERVDGLKEGVNSVKSFGTPEGQQTVRWVMDGRLTRAIPAATGQPLQLLDFFDFDLNDNTTDNFFVRSTSANVNISGAEFIQLSSTNDPANGNLDGIKHVVTIQANSDEGPTSSPSVLISNQAGKAGVYRFEQGNRITGLNGGGVVQFEGFSPSDGGSSIPALIEIFGSDSEADRFVIMDAWAAETVAHGLGGDDTFFLEGADLDTASQTTPKIINLVGGDGIDRIVLNDPDAIPDPVPINELFTRSYTIQDQTLSWLFQDEDGNATNTGPTVNFDDTTDIVRINATSRFKNIFDVYPNTTNTVVIDARAQTEFDDVLRIHEADGTLIPGNENDGVWVFEDGIRPVHFFGVEETFEVLEG